MLNQNESMRQSSLFKELLQESAKGHVPWVAWHAINSSLYTTCTRIHKNQQHLKASRDKPCKPFLHRVGPLGHRGHRSSLMNFVACGKPKLSFNLHGDITEGRNPEAAKRLHLMGGVGQKKI